MDQSSQGVDPQSWTVNLPLRVPVSKKSYFIINLNVYRNANFRVLAKAKIVFTELVTPLVRHLPVMECVSLSYKLFPASEREVDIANVCSIADKFFSDTLVSAGRIEDDNCKVVVSVDFKMGKVDPINPRVEATVFMSKKPLTQGNTMRITLNQIEIELALKNYVNKLLNVHQGIDMTIDIKATRGSDGMTAEIDLTDPSDGYKFLPQKVEVEAVVTKPVQILNKPVSVPEVPQNTTPVQQSTPEPVAQPEPEPAQIPQVHEPLTPPDEEVSPSVAPAEGETAVVAAKPKVGLFANLKKPVNQPNP